MSRRHGQCVRRVMVAARREGTPGLKQHLSSFDFLDHLRIAHPVWINSELPKLVIEEMG